MLLVICKLAETLHAWDYRTPKDIELERIFFFEYLIK